MKKKKKIFEDHVKKIYATTEPEQLIQEFKDQASVAGVGNKVLIKGKGAIDNRMAAFLYEYLEGFNIPTHFLKTISPKEMLVKYTDNIPVKITVRNNAAGTLVKRFRIEDGKELKCPVMEFFLIDEQRKNPMMNQSHLLAFELVTADELKMIERMSSKINAVLKSFLLRRHIWLVDFNLVFGRFQEKIILSHAITPETCRFWDVANGEKTDKNRFRLDAENMEQAYQEIKNRLLK